MAPKISKPDIPPPEWEQEASQDEPEQAWVGFARFVLLILFVLVLFLLGQGMVRHHFFTGGALNYENHPGGP